MDFISSLAKGAQPKPDSDHPGGDHPEKSAASSGLAGDAKLVAAAAQAQFRNEQYDKGKAAGAAANVLDAASHYAKLDETKGIGKYVEQAEGYLRHYNPTSGEHKTPATDAPTPAKESGDKKHAAESGHAEKPSGGGAGDYMKMAEGLLNKPSGEKKAEGSSEGGFGDMMKMAGGFLKK